jgi:adenylosuccinate synthase
MTAIAVIGAGFGDEGKGKVVSYLCTHQNTDSLIVRYCGGQQAGHHVILGKKDHVFSNFGSGTLQGLSTYWSKYCTIDPIGILNEYDILIDKSIKPKLYIDSRCPVTTPYEKLYNIKLDDLNKHGTVGVGVGQTYQREEDFYSITACDLLYPSVLKTKVDLLKKYYRYDYSDSRKLEEEIYNFTSICNELVNTDGIEIVEDIPVHNSYIFEGSQGLLLDQHFGFFPHVTRGNTGTRNILEMGYRPQVYLVMRAYQTRHGFGPMTNENHIENSNVIKQNPYENNFDIGCQGKFRTSLLDLDLLKYGIHKDRYIKEQGFTLVITCMDLMNGYVLTCNGKTHHDENEMKYVDKIRNELKPKNIYLSCDPNNVLYNIG